MPRNSLHQTTLLRPGQKIHKNAWDVKQLLEDAASFPVKTLRQKDIDDHRKRTGGLPFHLDSDTCYRMATDIVVDGSTDPSPRSSGTQTDHASLLRRFAVLIMDGERTVLDMDGHTLGATKDYVDTQNPFLNVLSMSNKPFLDGKGCKAFHDTPLRSAHQCVVMNGTIDTASHFCVHGAGSERVALLNMAFNNFEVGAVGFTTPDSDILIQDCSLSVRTDCRRAPAASGVIEAGAHGNEVPFMRVRGGHGKTYPRDASTVVGVQINGGFFVWHPTEGTRASSTAGVPAWPKGFHGRVGCVVIKNLKVHDLGMAFAEPQHLVHHQGAPLAIRDNFVMARVVNGSSFYDSANRNLLARALREKLSLGNAMSDDDVIAQHESSLTFVAQASRWDNRDHGMKPLAAVRLRGVSRGTVKKVNVNNMCVVSDMPTADQSARVVELTDCNHVDVTKVEAVTMEAASGSVGTCKTRCDNCEVGNSFRRTTTNSLGTFVAEKTV